MKLLIINGPNLNLLGKREPKIYGKKDFDSFLKKLRSTYKKVAIDYFQSNVEGEIVNKLQRSDKKYNGIILNAAAYSHYSVAILDAISTMKTPVIEVHKSNIYTREKFRHHSLISSACKGIICGLGLEGYRLAVGWFVREK